LIGWVGSSVSALKPFGFGCFIKNPFIHRWFGQNKSEDAREKGVFLFPIFGLIVFVACSRVMRAAAITVFVLLHDRRDNT
jgi:hypothetical protein